MLRSFGSVFGLSLLLAGLPSPTEAPAAENPSPALASPGDDGGNTREVQVRVAQAAPVSERVLPIRFHPQHTQVWCWAATIAMVAEYLKAFPLEDCVVLSEYDARLGGLGVCCAQPGFCNRTGQVQEMGAIIGNIFGLQGQHFSRPLSYADIVSQINNQHPMIAALTTGYSGHVVVLAGYRAPNTVVVLDPLYGQYDVAYDVLLANWTYGRWTETFTFTTPPATEPKCQVRGENVPYMALCQGPWGAAPCQQWTNRYRLQCWR